jgi:hypothetical protein
MVLVTNKICIPIPIPIPCQKCARIPQMANFSL